MLVVLRVFKFSFQYKVNIIRPKIKWNRMLVLSNCYFVFVRVLSIKLPTDVHNQRHFLLLGKLLLFPWQPE